MMNPRRQGAAHNHSSKSEEDNEQQEEVTNQMFLMKEPTPFCEKHIIENLSIEACDHSKQMLYYNMLNQGNKRGR